MVRERHSIESNGLETRTPDIVRPDLKPRGEDQAIQVVVHAIDLTAGGIDLLDPSTIGVDEMDVRAVERVEVLVVEARTLAQLAVPGLERRGRCWVVDHAIDALADLGHLLVVAVLIRPLDRFWIQRRTRIRHDPITDPHCDIRPSVVDQVNGSEAARLKRGEVEQPLVLPPRLQGPKPLRVDGLVVANVNR